MTPRTLGEMTPEQNGYRGDTRVPGLIANGLGFASGVGVLFLLPSLPPLRPLLLLTLGTTAAAWRRPRLRPFALAMIGLLWAWLHTCQVICAPFPETLVGRNLQLTGQVIGLPEKLGDGARFLFQVEHTASGGDAIDFHGLTRLRWYRNAQTPNPGERWRLTARLKAPHGFANPGGFDYERRLFQQGVKATGYVRDKDDRPRRLDAGPGTQLIHHWRLRLREHLQATLPNPIGQALTQALVLGDRSGLETEQWETLTRTGANHLIAISGLHIGIVSAFLFFATRWAWSHSSRLTLMIAAPRAGAIVALVGAILYSALAGFAIPTRRALIMLAVVLGAVPSSRTIRPLTGIVLALVGVLILDPRAVTSYSFWLSFSAVAALLAALGQRLDTGKLRGEREKPRFMQRIGRSLKKGLVKGRRAAPGSAADCNRLQSKESEKRPFPIPGWKNAMDGFFQRPVKPSKFWTKWGKAQWAITLGLLPLLLLLFGRVSLIAPLVNLIVVPLFGLLLPVVLAVSLLSLTPGLEPLLVLTAELLETGFGLLDKAALQTWATMTIPHHHPAWVWVSAFAGALLLLAPRGLPGRRLGPLFLLPLFLARPPSPGPGAAEFTLLDVGQGLAAVVRTNRHVLVYDTGPKFPSGFNTGDAVILPYLRNQGVSRIDTLIISHGDRDHAGGFAGLQDQLPIGRILSGEPQKIPAGNATHCLADDDWTWDGVDFDLLHPITAGRRAGNPSSCVLRVSIPDTDFSVLLTGDIGTSVESRLAKKYPERLASTVLVAGHHGSNTSTGTPFLEAVAPRFVLYSAGYANRYGFPAPAVRERVAAQGATQLDTASAGAIVFQSGSGGIRGPWSFRRDHPRLWSHRL